MTPTLATATMDTPIGELTLIASDAGLRAVLWPDDDIGRVRLRELPALGTANRFLDLARAQLDEYFSGERTEFEIPLDLQGTEFQIDVWNALNLVPFGETATYGEQAARVGRPKASRAVGAANGRNPASIVLPCHRVVGADGSLTGFAGGLETKQFLLRHEADVLARNG